MDPLPDADEPQPKSRAGLIVFVLVAVAGAGGAFFFWRQTKMTAQHDARTHAANAWVSLQQCLVGPTPLATGESVTLRLHRMEVNREPVGEGPAELQTRWPYRCGRYATALRDALGVLDAADAAQRRFHDLAEHVRERATGGFTETLHLHSHDNSFYDDLWAAAPAAHLEPGHADANIPAPPTPGAMLARADLQPLFSNPGGGEFTIVGTDRTPNTALHVVIAQGFVYGCTFPSDGAYATAHCDPTGAVARGGAIDATLFDADDGYPNFPPLRIGVGHDAQVTGITAATPSVSSPRAFAFRGSVTGAGVISIVDSGSAALDAAGASGAWHLARLLRGPAQVTNGFTGALRLPPESSRPDVLSDRVLYLASSEPGHGPARVGMISRDLGPLASGPGPAVDAGTVPEDSHIGGHCRTSFGLVVGTANDDHVTMFIRDATAWHPPQSFDGHWGRMSCSASSATVTWTDQHPPTIHQLRCTNEGCTAASEVVGSLTRVVGRNADPEIADADGTLILVWSPEEGGLRMRTGTIGHMNTAHDVVLYDDHAHLGGWVISPRLYTRGNTGVVVFVDSEVDATKRAAAIQIAHDGTFRVVAVH